MAGTDVGRVSISRYGGQNCTHVQQDRASILAGAANALFSVSSEAVHRSEAEPRIQNERASKTPEKLPAVVESDDGDEESVKTEELEDDVVVYKTESYREWECHYLKRLAKQIHRLVCNELARSEEALFMCFLSHDLNLDGMVREDEAPALLEAVERYAPEVDSSDLMDKNGCISFLSLLAWYSQGGEEYQETTTIMNATSLAVGMLGSGYVGADSRIDRLDWKSLRANILGYRKLYSKLRNFRENKNLARLQDLDSRQSLEEKLLEYYNLLALEFEGDEEYLFELFNDADVSGNMVLESREVEALLRKLDPNATKDELQRYTIEINVVDDRGLAFFELIDWWEQARNADKSLVVEKGLALIATVRANKLALGGYWSADSAVHKKWTEAAGKGPEELKVLQDAYARVYKEVRELKMNNLLIAAEIEAARL